MSVKTGRSRGGQNRISIAEHLQRVTYRPARHRQRLQREQRVSVPGAQRYDTNDEPIDETQCVSIAARARFLRGMPRVARGIAEGLLDEFWDWPAPALAMLKSLALTHERIARLEKAKRPDRRALRVETLTAQRLRRALKLEGA